MSKPLETAIDVFEVLGGTSSVAKLTGAKYSAAANWKQFGRFPPRTYVALQAALAGKGKSAPPTLWGMTLEDAS
jgi:hypothetical protein